MSSQPFPLELQYDDDDFLGQGLCACVFAMNEDYVARESRQSGLSLTSESALSCSKRESDYYRTLQAFIPHEYLPQAHFIVADGRAPSTAQPIVIVERVPQDFIPLEKIPDVDYFREPLRAQLIVLAQALLNMIEVSGVLPDYSGNGLSLRHSKNVVWVPSQERLLLMDIGAHSWVTEIPIINQVFVNIAKQRLNYTLERLCNI